MPYKKRCATGEYYHIYNRGVAKEPIFFADSDKERFLASLAYYVDGSVSDRFTNLSKKDVARLSTDLSKNPLVEIVTCCLMDNHYHLLLKQVTDDGVTDFMRKSMNSYARYINLKYERVGPLFQGRFKSVRVKSDEQLLHLARYIHLNPFVASITNDVFHYRWSMLREFLRNKKTRLGNSAIIFDIIGSKKRYKDFVNDYADYSRSVAKYTDLTFDFK